MIYFLRIGSDGLVKIGWSRNLERRMRHLQPGLPEKAEIIRTLEGERWVEGWLHKAFASSRRYGEWFAFDPEMLIVQPPTDKPGRRVGARVAPAWASYGKTLELRVWLSPADVGRLYQLAAVEGRTRDPEKSDKVA